MAAITHKINWNYIIIVLILLGYSYYKTEENEYLKGTKYTEDKLKKKNMGKTNVIASPFLYKKIADDYHIPYQALQAVYSYEDGNYFLKFGVLWIPEHIKKRYKPKKWQAAGCADIMLDEMNGYIFSNDERTKEYFEYLGKRYMKDDPNWGKDVYWLYIRLKVPANITPAPAEIKKKQVEDYTPDTTNVKFTS